MDFRKGIARLLVLACTLGGSSLFAAPTGSVTIYLYDENANLQEAPVYIYGVSNRFVGGNVVRGSESFRLQEGDYQISSATMVRIGDSFNRYASNNLRFHLTGGDHVQVILTLKPLRDRQLNLSYASLFH